MSTAKMLHSTAFGLFDAATRQRLMEDLPKQQLEDLVLRKIEPSLELQVPQCCQGAASSLGVCYRLAACSLGRSHSCHVDGLDVVKAMSLWLTSCHGQRDGDNVRQLGMFHAMGRMEAVREQLQHQLRALVRKMHMRREFLVVEARAE